MTKQKKKRILFTGGGTLGHVMPNIVLIKRLQSEGWEAYYIGSKNGPERQKAEELGIRYISIRTGKLRRYFSWQNFFDLFNITFGCIKAIWKIVWLRPNVTFSKGGFVAFPPVFASWLCRRPIVIHESDMSPGLATKLSKPFARKICTSFQNTTKYFPKEKVVHTGLPVRDELFIASPQKGLELANFKENKKVILVFGGSQGAQFLNDVIKTNTKNGNLADYNIINICGNGNLDKNIHLENFVQFESLSTDFLNIMACADLVITRGGATSLFELLAMKKPHIIIPLSKRASRGDQIENANYFKELGVSDYIEEEEYTWELLEQKIEETFRTKDELIQKMSALDASRATQKVLDIIKNTAK